MACPSATAGVLYGLPWLQSLLACSRVSAAEELPGIALDLAAWSSAIVGQLPPWLGLAPELQSLMRETLVHHAAFVLPTETQLQVRRSCVRPRRWELLEAT